MLAITTNNDITDNVRALKRVDEIPYYVEQNNALTLDNSFQANRTFVWQQSSLSRFGRWLSDHSRVVQALVEGHRALKVITASWRASWSGPHPAEPTPIASDQKANGPAPTSELGVDNLIYREPADDVWNGAWHVTEDLVK